MPENLDGVLERECYPIARLKYMMLKNYESMGAPPIDLNKQREPINPRLLFNFVILLAARSTSSSMYGMCLTLWTFPSPTQQQQYQSVVSSPQYTVGLSGHHPGQALLHI